MSVYTVSTVVTKGHRLPQNVLPNQYNLTLEPNLDKFTFNGTVDIEVNVLEVTDVITVNSLELRIEKVTFKGSSTGSVMEASAIVFNQEEESVTFKFESALGVGTGCLQIEFMGILNDRMKGFYRSKYGKGSDEYAAVTQFQANGARMCFPCWDEPLFKAKFKVTIVLDSSKLSENMKVLSNMPIESTFNDTSGTKRVFKFVETPKMSTYLVAFIVGKFDQITGPSSDGKCQIRVFTPVGSGHQGSFALESTVKVLKYYTEYFNISYPLPKLDLVSVPELSFGAMENWGIITFRENALLVDPENTSLKTKSYVASIIGHEVAHMWFGDLVTLSWWTHLWLNEGFATFMEYTAVDQLYPQFKLMDKFITDSFIPALEADALSNSHPIEVPITRAGDVSEIFDDISYNKGASVIRMCASYIGQPAFRSGVSKYLANFEYSNAETNDLWNHLSNETTNLPVALKDTMSTWTQQKGFPLIKVLSEQSNGTSQVIKVTQEKFSITGNVNSEEKNAKWFVPISFITSNSPVEPVKSILLTEYSTQITIDGVSQSDWIKLNPGSFGFYRVQYPSETLRSFRDAIKLKVLPFADRLSILSDLFALVLAGKSSTIDLLDLLPSFTDEDDYTVWSTIETIMDKLSQLIASSDLEKNWHKWASKLVLAIHEKLGWDEKASESPDDKLLRSLVIRQLAEFGESSVRAKCRQMFKGHLNKSQIISVNLRAAVYASVASEITGDSGDEESLYNSFLALYNETDLNEEKNRILASLGSMKSQTLISKLLNFSISPQVRSSDFINILRSVAQNPENREIAWQFFKQNAPLIKARYEGGFQLTHLVSSITSEFSTLERKKDVQSFFKSFHFAGTDITVDKALEWIQININWREKELPKMKEYLQGQ